MTELQAFKTEIGRLDREATAGPWETDFRYERMENIYGAAIVGPEGYLFSSEPDCGITEFEDETAFDSVARANALFIAYARTALPQLLALAEELEKERDELRKRLQGALRTIDDLNERYIEDNI